MRIPVDRLLDRFPSLKKKKKSITIVWADTLTQLSKDEIIKESGLSDYEKHRLLFGWERDYEEDDEPIDIYHAHLLEGGEKDVSTYLLKREEFLKMGLTSQQVCDLTGIEYHTLLKWVRKEYLKPIKWANMNIFPPDQLMMVGIMLKMKSVEGVPFTTV